MTTRRSFLAGLMASAVAPAAPAPAPLFKHVSYGVSFSVAGDFRAKALAAAMRQTQEIIAANVFNSAFGEPPPRA